MEIEIFIKEERYETGKHNMLRKEEAFREKPWFAIPTGLMFENYVDSTFKYLRKLGTLEIFNWGQGYYTKSEVLSSRTEDKWGPYFKENLETCKRNVQVANPQEINKNILWNYIKTEWHPKD